MLDVRVRVLSHWMSVSLSSKPVWLYWASLGQLRMTIEAEGIRQDKVVAKRRSALRQLKSLGRGTGPGLECVESEPGVLGKGERAFEQVVLSAQNEQNPCC